MNRVSFAMVLALAGATLTPVLRAATESNTADPSAEQARAPAASTWPLPLEMRVPFEPTAFPSAGRTYLTYELYLTNFGTAPLTLRRVEVFDADAMVTEPIAAFEEGQLDTLLQRVGEPIVGDQIPVAGASDWRQVAAGGSVVVFLSIALERGTHVPNKLRHRVLTADSTVEGAVVGTHQTKLRVLGPPLKGAHWIADSGPSNDSHHRRGIVVFDGRALISRRYAIDWQQIENGALFSGDALDNRSYHAYGKVVLAVANGTVTMVKDGIPENVPNHKGIRAVPMSLETIAGNTITLDLGGGQFANYLHLQPGSLRVKAGDRVRRGQILARIGNSGDSTGPHLHFQVSTESQPLAAEGVPYLIDQYRVKSADDVWQTHTRELPLRDMLIDFGQIHGDLN
jgi:murein DD-endopeptidase MepM/ murein hydrolase activator NlpD